MRRWLSLKATYFAFWLDPVGFKERLGEAMWASNQALLKEMAKNMATLFPVPDYHIGAPPDEYEQPTRPTLH